MSSILPHIKSFINLAAEGQNRLQAWEKKTSFCVGKRVDKAPNYNDKHVDLFKIKFLYYVIKITALVSLLLFCAAVVTMFLAHFQKLPLLVPLGLGGGAVVTFASMFVLKFLQLGVAERVSLSKKSQTYL